MCAYVYAGTRRVHILCVVYGGTQQERPSSVTVFVRDSSGSSRRRTVPYLCWRQRWSCLDWGGSCKSSALPMAEAGGPQPSLMTAPSARQPPLRLSRYRVARYTCCYPGAPSTSPRVPSLGQTVPAPGGALHVVLPRGSVHLITSATAPPRPRPRAVSRTAEAPAPAPNVQDATWPGPRRARRDAG